MKSITIHGMDDEMDRQIREKATAEGKSLNNTIKGLLKQALGGRRSRREEFADLFGCWSAADLAEFEEATKDLRQIDPDDWKSRRKSRNSRVRSVGRESARDGLGASRLGGR